MVFYFISKYSQVNLHSTELYYYVIDLQLQGGLGGVIQGQENLIAIQDTITNTMAVCKHGNGRDWWVVVLKDSTNIAYTLLLTRTGIGSVTQQTINVPLHHNDGQSVFSPDGKRYAYHERTFTNLAFPVTHGIRIFDFDRCTGLFSNEQIVDLVEWNYSGNGLCFSPNSKYLYFTTFNDVYQINTDTTNLQASLTKVATYDGFYSPYPSLNTDFWQMYLAANGKIYICSGSSVIDMHYIDSPDSGGLSCNVVQHGLHLPTYSGRGHVLHPNYYLGCDTSLGCPCLSASSIQEFTNHDFKFSLSPNPTNGNVKIMYLLPNTSAGLVGASGVFEIYDVEGRKVFTYNLSPWSTLQHFNLSFLHDGVYSCVIKSGGYMVSRKLVVIK